MAAHVLGHDGRMNWFKDRADAGRRLRLRSRCTQVALEVLILALPRGGVAVAREVASALAVPFDIFLVRKLGVPGHPELAMGAIAEGGVQVLSDELIRELDIPIAWVEEVVARERVELERRQRLYRGARQPPNLQARTVILVDDGVATGSTMEAAVVAVRQQSPAAVIVAVPVGARETCGRLAAVADRVVCLETPEPFTAVGSWYVDFSQASDEDVTRLTRSEGPS